MAKDSSSNDEFKPGDVPYLQYGKETLNADVAWDEVVSDLLEKNYTIESIAHYAETEARVIRNCLHQIYQGLSFRAGARILSIHCRLYPEIYN